LLFNSYLFIFLYLPVVLITFFGLARISHSFAATWLALASIFFYGYWNSAYVILLMGSILCNYIFGLWISRITNNKHSTLKKNILIAGIFSNLVLLAYYKYTNFFVDSINSVTAYNWEISEIILPLGISFFTFTQIAFLIDTFQGKVKEYNFIHYILFVTYFPHLLAGPVLHHQEMMPQFRLQKNYVLNWENIATGLLLFTLGLSKKTLFADSFAPYSNAIFEAARQGQLLTIYEAWFGALSYTMQIYFDFSGYTDMALGIALMFNIILPVNFNSPYKATSIIEFWRRWHMTLSRYLRDYLYIPLGGNRLGKSRRYINLFITMLLGGLWHGAGWVFLIWGALHGFYLTVNHLWREKITAKITIPVPAWFSILFGGGITFIAVVVAWVVFRSHDLSHAATMFRAMSGMDYQSISFFDVTHGKLLPSTDLSGSFIAKLMFVSLIWIWFLPSSNNLKFKQGKLLRVWAQIVIVLTFLALSIDQFGSYSPFLYFQF